MSTLISERDHSHYVLLGEHMPCNRDWWRRVNGRRRIIIGGRIMWLLCGHWKHTKDVQQQDYLRPHQ
jgi:hypothetical protein